MTVTPHSRPRLHTEQDLYQCLLACQQQSSLEEPAIASLSWEIPSLDPLMVLQALAVAQQPHFYFEHRRQQMAIAAVGSAVAQCSSHPQRFQDARHFMDDCLRRCQTVHSPSLLHFFCSFTFFPQVSPGAPFPGATVFIPAWQVINQGDRTSVTANLEITPQTALRTVTRATWTTLEQVRSLASPVVSLCHRLDAMPGQVLSEETDPSTSLVPFQASVRAVLGAIAQGRLQKVVLAHALDVVSPQPFSVVRSVDNLRRRYPDCYVFSTGNDQGHSFIGASPERLLSVRDRALVVDALAGSSPRGGSPQDDADLADRLRHSPKERHEHQVVVDFIAAQLQAAGLTPRYAPEPDLLRLSNIQHLHTPIHARMPNSLHPLALLANLHPTPAVAGVSRDVACQEILRHESFERSLYAAPIGWIDHQGNSEFVVGIRSAWLHGNRARLYAGAGIVAGSNPDRELAEVHLKLQALLQALV
ncbi:MAG: isochorismate synthase [Synechococcales cyanobacterium K44_A2020_017]|nr:isochorismate synthase [Synechococcales cyanobacterium K32_A2020_035]MBF2093993.1 isochorismate synthase [Synechococcales cyanobacterium K44_A2020_017]